MTSLGLIRTQPMRHGLLILVMLASCAGPQPAAPAAAAPTATQPTAASAPAPAAPAQQDAAAVQSPLGKRLSLENRLDVALMRHAGDLTQSAEIAVMLQGGTETSRRGAVELAAHLLVHSADVTSGRQSLARQVEQMGGILTVDIGRKSTWIHVRTPAAAWQRAAQALATSLEVKDAPRSQVERSQQELIARQVDASKRDPVGVATLRILLGDESPASHAQDLQSRDAGEAVAFHRRYYRPDRSLLVVRAPGAEAQVEAAVRASFGAWEAANPAPEGEITTSAKPLPKGIAWIRDGRAADAPCDVAMVLQLPDSLAKDAVALHVLASCLTVDGIGGRLERLQQEAGLSRLQLRAETIRFGEGSALCLRGTMLPQEAVRLHSTALAARQSLRDIPVSTSERTRARAAAWLSLRSAGANASTLLRDEIERIVLGVDANAQMQALIDLDRPGAPGAETVREFLSLPLTTIVLGGEPPAGVSDLRLCPLEPEAVAIPVAQANDAAMQAEALPWKRRAIDAIGGTDKVSGLFGYSADRTVETEGAPSLEESTTWTASGDLVRTRKVLGASIETRLQGSAWTEDAAGKRAQLTPQEAEWRRREAARHPIALLIAWNRGDLEFRRIATRKVGDRELETLEALGEKFERLRIDIDRESGLLRSVECWAQSPDGVATRTIETWTDYRTVDGIRAPFRCTTVVDDGQSQRVSTYLRFAPVAR